MADKTGEGCVQQPPATCVLLNHLCSLVVIFRGDLHMHACR